MYTKCFKISLAQSYVNPELHYLTFGFEQFYVSLMHAVIQSWISPQPSTPLHRHHHHQYQQLRSSLPPESYHPSNIVITIS